DPECRNPFYLEQSSGEDIVQTRTGRAGSCPISQRILAHVQGGARVSTLIYGLAAACSAVAGIAQACNWGGTQGSARDAVYACRNLSTDWLFARNRYPAS